MPQLENIHQQQRSPSAANRQNNLYGNRSFSVHPNPRTQVWLLAQRSCECTCSPWLTHSTLRTTDPRPGFCFKLSAWSSTHLHPLFFCLLRHLCFSLPSLNGDDPRSAHSSSTVIIHALFGDLTYSHGSDHLLCADSYQTYDPALAPCFSIHLVFLTALWMFSLGFSTHVTH